MSTIRIMSTKSFSVTVALFLAVAAAKAEPAMWVIRDKDSTIYLIGTVHLLRHETEWNAAKVTKTVTESTELWLEVADIDDQASALPLITQYGMDPKKTLSSKLNAAQKEKLAKVAATYGVPLESLEPMRPWMAALTFSVLPLQKAGYDPKRRDRPAPQSAGGKGGRQNLRIRNRGGAGPISGRPA